jgi:dihydrodipicolinate synthase/N-acetylneuraminate lyase
MHVNWRGVFPAATTPFHADRLAAAAFARLAPAHANRR